MLAKIYRDWKGKVCLFIYLFAMGQFLAAQLQPYSKGTFYVALHKKE